MIKNYPRIIFKSFAFILLLLSFQHLDAQTTLSYNVGNVPIQTSMPSCGSTQAWARAFTLSDFGISHNDKFVINSGQVAIYNSLGGGTLQFNIFFIDSDFPNSHASLTNLIASSQIVNIPVIGDVPEIITVHFDVPVVIPDGIERILVEVRKSSDINNRDTSLAYIAGTEADTGTSYYWGCQLSFPHRSTENLEPPVDNANFFINVTGERISTTDLGTPTRLTHNPCEEVVNVRQYSCSWAGLKYARSFVLEDFGVSNNEEFIIDRAQVAFASVGVYDVKVQFNIYKIDDNFPASYSEDDLIGSSRIINVPYFGSRPRVFDIVFGTPIVIPADVDKVLVEVFNLGSASSSGLAFIAGGAQSTGESWLRSEALGCPPFKEYIAVTNPNINYYINVTGRTRHVTDNFEINMSNNCSEFLKEFRIENSANVASVLWDFGDPASGTNNTSTSLTPFHNFTTDGIHTITATVTAHDGRIEVISETFDIEQPPHAYGIDDVYACEDLYDTGIASTFDLSTVTQQVLGGQVDKIVTFIDGSGALYSALPQPFTNTVRDVETITVRVAHQDNPCCYSETTFDLIVHPLPTLTTIPDFTSCEISSNGFAEFDLSAVASTVIGGQTGFSVAIFDGYGHPLSNPLPNPYVNRIPNKELITVRVTNDVTGCQNELTFSLHVNEQPVAYPLDVLIGCDDNDDGISEYFDTSQVEAQAVGTQAGMVVSYFDASGTVLPTPLPNPLTNTEAHAQQITVRVTNPQSGCYAETLLNLETSAQPHINTPNDLYACDIGNGFAYFDTSAIESALIGNQTGLAVLYYDELGNALPSPLPDSFINTRAYQQTITVRVENTLNRSCYSETAFDLIVNRLPEINLEDDYFICNLEPSIILSVNPNFDTYEWSGPNGSSISSTAQAEIIAEGRYVLTVTQLEHGIYCENSFSFHLTRSVLPSIQQVNYGELGNNFIEIIVSGDGHFEYSIDGINYQDSNYFSNVRGGIYTVYARDKDGCGDASQKVIIVDYPKFFTPNGDGYNDSWHLKGITEFPNSKVFIYDRYGKILAQLSSYDLGWDGLYNGTPMLANDYWFSADFGNGNHFSGHFTLKR